MGFSIGSVFKVAFNPMNALMLATPAGWAALAMKTIGAQIGMNVLQQLGEKLNLPQPLIDISQAAFAQSAGLPGLARQEIGQAIGGLGELMNFSPRQQADLTRRSENVIEQLINQAVRERLGFDDGNGNRGRGSRAAQSGDFFTEFAKVMGEKLNDGFGQLKRTSDATNFKDAKAVTEFQAEQQKFSFFMNSVSTALKSMGEAINNMARKS